MLVCVIVCAFSRPCGRRGPRYGISKGSKRFHKVPFGSIMFRVDGSVIGMGMQVREWVGLMDAWVGAPLLAAEPSHAFHAIAFQLGLHRSTINKHTVV